MAPLSKTNVEARKAAKVREKFFGPCDHEVKPVRVMRRMVWYCETCPQGSNVHAKWTRRQ